MRRARIIAALGLFYGARRLFRLAERVAPPPSNSRPEAGRGRALTPDEQRRLARGETLRGPAWRRSPTTEAIVRAFQEVRRL